ncbi:hypothetical protein T265_14246, partial [Opisthorchis viverrini]
SHDGYREESDGLLVPDGPNSRYASQKEVYDDLGRGILDNAFSGYACSLFAYGQTGSGKSYSIMGYGPNRGIVPIVCEELFNRVQQNTDQKLTFQVSFSMLEIYNEQIRDLLNTSSSQKSLQLRQSPSMGFYVQGLTQIPVGSYKEVEQRMKQGNYFRFMRLSACQFGFNEGLTYNSAEFLVYDLHLNKALADGKKVVPYRDSVLTKLLQNALGGNSKTIMIAAISPADINYQESLSTLRYADRAKRIKNKAIVNEDPMEKLIRELKEENERLKLSLQSSELPPNVDGRNISPQEMEKLRVEMREELMAQMKANMAEIESQNQQAFTTKLEAARKEAAEMAIRSTAQEDKSGGTVKNKPYLENLNEDPQLSGIIKHLLVHKTTGFGRKPPAEQEVKKQKVHWITIQGLGLADQHAFLIRHGKSGAEIEIRVAPGASKLTKVNGIPLKESTILKNKDRVLFGSYQLYVFHNPLDSSNGQHNADLSDEVIDWEFAQRELARASGIDGFDGKPKSKDDMIIQKQLLELIPMVGEVNEIAEELDKARSFDLLLIPPTAQGLPYGEAGTTKLMIRMRDSTTSHVWLWDREKFMGRRFVMQEMYQNYLHDVKKKTSEEDDPFVDSLDDKLLGVAPVYLQALGYRLDVDDKLSVMSFEGEVVGTLYYQLIPCTRAGKPLTELSPAERIHCDIVSDPNELLGKPFHYKILLSDLDLSDEYDGVQVRIRYRVFKETDWTVVNFPIDYFRSGATIRNLIDHSRVISITQVTFDHLNYFENSCIGFLVYASQSNGNKRGSGAATKVCHLFVVFPSEHWIFQETNPLASSVRASRRCSTVQAEECMDVNRMKTELCLLQRNLEQYAACHEKLKGQPFSAVPFWRKAAPLPKLTRICWSAEGSTQPPSNCLKGQYNCTSKPPVCTISHTMMVHCSSSDRSQLALLTWLDLRKIIELNVVQRFSHELDDRKVHRSEKNSSS